MRHSGSWFLSLLGLTLLLCPGCGSRAGVRVGSKAFTESVILGEMVRLLAVHIGESARHDARLGDTSKAWNALLVGDLNIYPEYTGTLKHELLAADKVRTPQELDEALARKGLKCSKSLGFRNNYALGMPEALAKRLGISTISDLVKHPDLRLGFSHAFIERDDGWAGLKRAYQLPFAKPQGMEHALAYKGLLGGNLDLIDLYTTDAEIARYGLRVLADDKGYFPAYDAVLLYRADLEKRSPAALKEILRLEGSIDESTMQRLNSQANIEHEPEGRVAADFLRDKLGVSVDVARETLLDRIWPATLRHALMVFVSLFLAIVVAVPLGIVAARRPIVGQGILAVVGAVQTIPSLALLSFLIIALQQIGVVPALVALFLYSLLPIVRNTFTGLTDIPLHLRESAEALGLTAWDRLILIELPMASRSILGGIKTAAVINVGFATLGGLIGAGGYGQAIISGLDKNNTPLILEGAVPAVVMALLVQGLFEVIERLIVPKGLRLQAA